jgi:hypothetical protein
VTIEPLNLALSLARDGATDAAEWADGAVLNAKVLRRLPDGGVRLSLSDRVIDVATQVDLAPGTRIAVRVDRQGATVQLSLVAVADTGGALPAAEPKSAPPATLPPAPSLRPAPTPSLASMIPASVAAPSAAALVPRGMVPSAPASPADAAVQARAVATAAVHTLLSAEAAHAQPAVSPRAGGMAQPAPASGGIGTAPTVSPALLLATLQQALAPDAAQPVGRPAAPLVASGTPWPVTPAAAGPVVVPGPTLPAEGVQPDPATPGVQLARPVEGRPAAAAPGPAIAALPTPETAAQSAIAMPKAETPDRPAGRAPVVGSQGGDRPQSAVPTPTPLGVADAPDAVGRAVITTGPIPSTPQVARDGAAGAAPVGPMAPGPHAGDPRAAGSPGASPANPPRAATPVSAPSTPVPAQPVAAAPLAPVPTAASGPGAAPSGPGVVPSAGAPQPAARVPASPAHATAPQAQPSGPVASIDSAQPVAGPEPTGSPAPARHGPAAGATPPARDASARPIPVGPPAVEPANPSTGAVRAPAPDATVFAPAEAAARPSVGGPVMRPAGALMPTGGPAAGPAQAPTLQAGEQAPAGADAADPLPAPARSGTAPRMPLPATSVPASDRVAAPQPEASVRAPTAGVTAATAPTASIVTAAKSETATPAASPVPPLAGEAADAGPARPPIHPGATPPAPSAGSSRPMPPPSPDRLPVLKAALDAAVSEAVTGQASLAPLLARAQALVEAAPAAVPRPVFDALAHLIGLRLSITPDLDGQRLRAALAQSGPFFEAHDAAAGTERPMGDVKAALVEVKAALTEWLGDRPTRDAPAGERPPPPRRGDLAPAQPAPATALPKGALDAIGPQLQADTDAALDRLLLTQYASLDAVRDPQAARAEATVALKEWQMELPVLIGRDTHVIPFQVTRDRRRRRDATGAETLWRVRFALASEPLGPIVAQITLTEGQERDRTLAVTLWADRAASVETLRRTTRDLREALDRAGLVLDEIACLGGTPDHPEPIHAPIDRRA